MVLTPTFHLIISFTILISTNRRQHCAGKLLLADGNTPYLVEGTAEISMEMVFVSRRDCRKKVMVDVRRRDGMDHNGSKIKLDEADDASAPTRGGRTRTRRAMAHWEASVFIATLTVLSRRPVPNPFPHQNNIVPPLSPRYDFRMLVVPSTPAPVPASALMPTLAPFPLPSARLATRPTPSSSRVAPSRPGPSPPPLSSASRSD